MSAGAIPHPRPEEPGDQGPLGAWFLEFLRRELAPFPGRASLVARMTIAATLTMILIMTFHIPNGALGGYFALTVSRESLRSTIQTTWLTIVFFALGTVYTLFSLALFVDSPLTHFLWVIGSFYLIFFVMGTAKNYNLGAGFSFLIATAIPIWDRAGEVNIKVALTLYILLAVALGTGCSLLVELVYRSFHPEDPVLAGIADRLLVAGTALQGAADGQVPTRQQTARLLQYAMVGPSSLRTQLIRAGISAELRARVAAVVAVAGRVVELAATSTDFLEHHPEPQPQDAEDRARLRALARTILGQAARIKGLSALDEIGNSTLPAWKPSEMQSTYLPVLPELERSVALLSEIANSFGVPVTAARPRKAGREKTRRRASDVALMLGSKPSAIFVPDAFTNRGHLVFALRGCLAATICYLIYNGIDWPGINTCIATCIITALGTIGASRQKQLLRIAGAFAGGFLISLPAQVYLLPYIDSIAAFTLYFAAVSCIAAWFATSSPRLSYFGLQLALAFYLINLQEFTIQISLAVARDRVVGVLLGLVVMWVVFDQIAAPRATVVMDNLLRKNLGMIGDFACAVTEVSRRAAGDREESAELGRFRQLRDSINDTFSQMNAQADAVVFEFGRLRAQRLRERERMQTMQPAMRSLFLLEIALFESDKILLWQGGSSESMQAPALEEFLARIREALRCLAAIPVPGAHHLPEAPSNAVEAANCLARVEEALGGVESTVGRGKTMPVTLCTSMVSSLRTLTRAATA